MIDGSNFLVFLQGTSDFVFYGKSSGTEFTKTLSGITIEGSVISHSDADKFYFGYKLTPYFTIYEIDTTTFSSSNSMDKADYEINAEFTIAEPIVMDGFNVGGSNSRKPRIVLEHETDGYLFYNTEAFYIEGITRTELTTYALYWKANGHFYWFIKFTYDGTAARNYVSLNLFEVLLNTYMENHSLDAIFELTGSG